MTCIVGLVQEKTVYIGGDSAGTAGWGLKVYKNSARRGIIVLQKCCWLRVAETTGALDQSCVRGLTMDNNTTLSGIYAIVNRVDNKHYIGRSINIKNRWYNHKYQLQKGSHHCIKLQRAWNKHGKEAFDFIVLESVEDIEQL